MRILLDNVKMLNFLSFGEAEVDFRKTGYTLVQGINNNPSDLAKSNGSGKSSIFEAVVWSLTGETIRGSKDICNLNTDNGAYVEIDFTIDNSTYKVIRTKEYKPLGTTLKIYVNGEDKSGKGIRDSEKILHEYLPDLTSSLIGSVIILGQGLPQRFTNNTPSGRKDVLEKLSKSDFMIQDLKDRIASRKIQLGTKLRYIEDEILTLNTKKDMYEKELLDCKIKLNTLEDTSVSELEDKIHELEYEVGKIEESDAEINDKISNLTISEDTITQELLDFQQKEADALDAVSNDYNDILDELERNKIQINGKYCNAVNELNRLKNIKDTCPTCGQKLPNVFKSDTTEIEQQITQLQNELTIAERLFREKQTEFKNKRDEVKNSYSDTHSKLQSNLRDVKDKLYSAKNKKVSIDKELSSYNQKLAEIIAKVNSYNELKTSYLDKISNMEHSISSCEESILYNNNEKDELQKHLDVITKMNTVITRDFRGYLLTSVIDFINRKAKEYSQEVFETDKIDFSLDGNNISISYDGKDYSNLSGGERQKVDLIVQFSIRDMLCKYLNFSSNVLAVDELFDNLDSIGCEKVLNLISTKLTDVESIYIITHHNDISIPSDNILTVTKGEDGISRVN